MNAFCKLRQNVNREESTTALLVEQKLGTHVILAKNYVSSIKRRDLKKTFSFIEIWKVCCIEYRVKYTHCLLAVRVLMYRLNQIQ